MHNSRNPAGKGRKSSVEECIFDYYGIAYWMLIQQKRTPPVFLFSDFAGWEIKNNQPSAFLIHLFVMYFSYVLPCPGQNWRYPRRWHGRKCLRYDIRWEWRHGETPTTSSGQHERQVGAWQDWYVHSWSHGYWEGLYSKLLSGRHCDIVYI